VDTQTSSDEEREAEVGEEGEERRGERRQPHSPKCKDVGCTERVTTRKWLALGLCGKHGKASLKAKQKRQCWSMDLARQLVSQ
jgi:hypothetical protein